jgi:hypothetical protein
LGGNEKKRKHKRTRKENYIEEVYDDYGGEVRLI